MQETTDRKNGRKFASFKTDIEVQHAIYYSRKSEANTSDIVKWIIEKNKRKNNSVGLEFLLNYADFTIITL